MMKAIQVHEAGGPEQLFLGDFPKPKPSKGEVLVRAKATALNRADTLQRQGKYPPPKGASPIMGLEIAGEIHELGAEVTGWKIGDRVMALLPGGGYAQYATIPSGMLMRIPENLSFEEAAAIPEVFLTAYQAIHWIGKLSEQETILIHAGASGVGTAAIQLSKLLRARIFVTASPTKHDMCMSLGADHAINYREENFEEIVLDQTHGRGANLIIDFLSAQYFQQNLNVLSMDGRMVFLALMGGIYPEKVNLAPILVKRLSILGSTLRARTQVYKESLTQEFWTYASQKFAEGELRPVIDSIYTWEKVAEAHQYMEANKNQGKIIMTIS